MIFQEIESSCHFTCVSWHFEKNFSFLNIFFYLHIFTIYITLTKIWRYLFCIISWKLYKILLANSKVNDQVGWGFLKRKNPITWIFFFFNITFSKLGKSKFRNWKISLLVVVENWLFPVYLGVKSSFNRSSSSGISCKRNVQ